MSDSSQHDDPVAQLLQQPQAPELQAALFNLRLTFFELLRSRGIPDDKMARLIGTDESLAQLTAVAMFMASIELIKTVFAGTGSCITPDLRKELLKFADELLSGESKTKGGRPSGPWVTEAAAMWLSGLRGASAYRRFIPNYDKVTAEKRRAEYNRVTTAARNHLKRLFGPYVNHFLKRLPNASEEDLDYIRTEVLRDLVSGAIDPAQVPSEVAIRFARLSNTTNSQ